VEKVPHFITSPSIALKLDRETMQLTTEQLGFFKDNGYLIVAGVMDRQLCAKARDRLWDSLPATSKIKRNDPTTHIGPFDKRDVKTDHLDLRQEYRWQLRSVGTEPLLIDLVFSPTLQAIATQLLGANMLQPPQVGGRPMGTHGAAWPGGPVDPADNQGARGIYATLPYGDRPRETDRCHTDGHPFNLGMVGLIDAVPRDGGGFKVWPGSHRRLYSTFQMSYDQPRIPYYPHLPSYKGILHTPEYLAEIKKINDDTPAVDCWGSEGDVVLWHHRTAHMAGHNYSDKIRQAVLYDFTRNDLDHSRMHAPRKDMWHDWSGSLRQVKTTYSRAFSESQHLG
jgi:hypothetical protein